MTNDEITQEILGKVINITSTDYNSRIFKIFFTGNQSKYSGIEFYNCQICIDSTQTNKTIEQIIFPKSLSHGMMNLTKKYNPGWLYFDESIIITGIENKEFNKYYSINLVFKGCKLIEKDSGNVTD
jgi:hypothetical protein